jgi:hypothetical protein
MRVLTRGLESLAEAVATSGDVALSNTSPHGGSYCLRCNAPGSAVAWAQFGRADGSALDLTTAYVRFWFRFTTYSAINPEEIFAAEGAGGYKLFARLTGSRTLAVFARNGLTSMGSGTTVLTANTWYMLEFMVSKEASEGANNGLWAVRINGTPELSGSGDISAENTSYIRLGTVVNRSATGSQDSYFDDLAIDDTNWPGATDAGLTRLITFYRRQRCS